MIHYPSVPLLELFARPKVANERHFAFSVLILSQQFELERPPDATRMSAAAAAPSSSSSKFLLYIGQKNYSSWSMRPWMLLRNANFDFDEICIEVEGGGFNPRHQAYSPSGLVPCLHDTETGQRVWDSLGIAEWLAERLPAGCVWPADPAARAYARCIALEMHSGFPDVRANMPCNFKMRLNGGPMSDKTALQVERIATIWAEARAKYGIPSGAGPYLFGAFSAADAMYAPVVSRFVSYNVSLDAWPEAKAYAAAMLNNAFYKQWEAAALVETNPIGHYDETALRVGNGRREGKCSLEAAAEVAAAASS